VLIDFSLSLLLDFDFRCFVVLLILFFPFLQRSNYFDILVAFLFERKTFWGREKEKFGLELSPVGQKNIHKERKILSVFLWLFFAALNIYICGSISTLFSS
jgi:hypothetical protein